MTKHLYFLVIFLMIVVVLQFLHSEKFLANQSLRDEVALLRQQGEDHRKTVIYIDKAYTIRTSEGTYDIELFKDSIVKENWNAPQLIRSIEDVIEESEKVRGKVRLSGEKTTTKSKDSKTRRKK